MQVPYEIQPEQTRLRNARPLCNVAPLNDLWAAEVQDDWSCATFWYEPVPSAALPPMPDAKARTADLWQD